MNFYYIYILWSKLINFLLQKIFTSPQYAEGTPTSFFIHYSPDKLVYNIPELIQYAVPKHSVYLLLKIITTFD